MGCVLKSSNKYRFFDLITFNNFSVVRFNYVMYSLRFDEDCEDDITEPIASCTSVSPQVRYILKANPFQHLLLVKKSRFS